MVLLSCIRGDKNMRKIPIKSLISTRLSLNLTLINFSVFVIDCN